MNKTLAEATLKQFKALPVTFKTDTLWKPKKTIPYGFLINAKVSEKEFELCKTEVGLTPEQMNKTFHKSWDKIRETSQEQLWFEQILHYITTYGFKELGIYSDDTVFIPCEKLEIPNVKKDKVFLTVIKGLTKTELKNKVIKVLMTGIALKEETIQDYLTILKYTGFTQQEVSTVKNKEMLILLCDELDIVPNNPVEFLRYIVYSVTNSTLLIKDFATLEAIKKNISNTAYKSFKKADMEGLATIFNRFKPLFLAFKKDKRLIPYINKISKLSKTHHKPMPIDVLNNVTSMSFDEVTLQKALDKANIFRKIRLLYALNIRIEGTEALLYKIRNGKSYVKEYTPLIEKKYLKSTYKTVLRSITMQLNVEGKKIYIPKGIRYSLPATEKQFTGEFPSGTAITVNENMLVGIHWEDFNGNVDLDLSTISMRGKIGWNSVHKSTDLKILFSGDMTNSSKGATEVFYIGKGIKEPLLLVNNVYSGEVKVPFDIFVAKDKVTSLRNDYTVDPNKVLLRAKTEMKYKQKILGIILPLENGKMRFVLSENSTRGNVSHDTPVTKMTRDYLYNFYTSAISLKKVLKMAGAEFVEQEDAELDLSPEKVTKADFINLLSPQNILK